jgi:hypothetical protein
MLTIEDIVSILSTLDVLRDFFSHQQTSQQSPLLFPATQRALHTNPETL